MSEQFARWQAARDEKNETNGRIGSLIALHKLSEEQLQEERTLVLRYNALYEAMYRSEEAFDVDDWLAYETEQESNRVSERQAWLITERYGCAAPSTGIADWWLA